MKSAVIQIAPVYALTQAQLERDYAVLRYYEAADKSALLAQAADVRVAVTSGFHGMNAALMAQLPKLQLIACFGVGVDAIDLAAARARHIAVTNTPDVLTDDVADLAIGLMLAAMRRIPQADCYVREGKWLKAPMSMHSKVSGKRLGVIGMGRIGQAIAKRAAAFDMTIAYHGPSKKNVPYRYEPDLVALAGNVDVLIAACPGGAATQRIVNRAVLETLGSKGTFVNIARGSVVDEAALIEVLKAGHLGAAGLDVFADEPNVPSALLAFDNVVVQPHQVSATHETRAAMGQLVLDNVAAYFAGKPLITPFAH